MISWFEKHSKFSWLITIIIAIVIFYISSLSFDTAYGQGFGWETIAYHFYAFLFLTGFFLVALIKGKHKNKKFIILGILIMMLYAASDEIHQLFVPGRCATIFDFLIDASGILFAAGLYSLYVYKKR